MVLVRRRYTLAKACQPDDVAEETRKFLKRVLCFSIKHILAFIYYDFRRVKLKICLEVLRT